MATRNKAVHWVFVLRGIRAVLPAGDRASRCPTTSIMRIPYDSGEAPAERLPRHLDQLFLSRGHDSRVWLESVELSELPDYRMEGSERGTSVSSSLLRIFRFVAAP